MKALTIKSQVLSSIKGEFVYYNTPVPDICQHFFTIFLKKFAAKICSSIFCSFSAYF